MKAIAEALRDRLLASAPVNETEPERAAKVSRVASNRELSTSGHLTLAALVICLACASYLIAQKEARRLIDMVGYCQREPLKLQTTLNSPFAALSILNSVLPTATRLQQQRLIQQGNELIALYTYHCKSVQAFSTNYQAILFVANGSAVASATMLALLSMHGIKSEVRWPFTVLITSAFTLGLSVATIQTFRLDSNLSTSRALLEQTNVLTRSFATSIANQSYEEASGRLLLLNQQDLGLFIDAIDQRLKGIDVPSFAMDDNFAAKEVQLLLSKPAKTNAQPRPEPKT